MRKFLILSVLLISSSTQGADKKNGLAPVAPTTETVLDVVVDSKIKVKTDQEEFEATLRLIENNAIHLPYRTANKLGLKGSIIGAYDIRDRSTSQKTVGGSANVVINSQKRDVAFYWPGIGNAEDKIITIGPEALGVDVISMKLANPKLDEKIFGFKLIKFSEQFPGWNASVGTLAVIGDRATLVKFAPHLNQTVVTGMVGRLFVTNFGGYYTANSRVDDYTAGEISQTGTRLRRMTTGSPLLIGNLAISDVDVYDSEGKDGKIIPSRPKFGADDPEYGIVVEAMKKVPRNVSYPEIYLGMDALAGCSNITLDFPAKVIYLSCVPNAASGGIQLSPTGAYLISK